RSDGITVTESISQIGRMVQRKMEGIQKVQALMMRKLENLEEKVESMSHEVKKLARLHSNRHADKYPRSEPYQEGATLSEPNANIRLRFLDGLRTPIYTDKIITSQSNAAIRVGVFDGEKMINEGPLSKAKVEILVLRGDFCSDGQESWTEEEFNSHIAQGRHRQGSVLGGDCSAWLNNGEASLGKIRFREGSSRTPSRKFIVGGRVCMNRKIGGIRVQEAVMEPVTVLDRRNEANEKRHPPRLDDEVYRLEEISRDGIYHRRLKNVHIFTVEDFLKALNKDADVLREMVLEIKKRSNAWERMVKHARECCLADRPELKAYHSVEGNVVIFFNCVHDLVGAIFYGVYVSRDNFDPAKKAQAYELKECARGQLDILPFDYVMNGNLPEQVPSSTHSTLDAAFILGPDVALQPNENQLQDRINNITEPSHQNEYIHGDQSTVNTHYFQ
uniref:Calmodulin-binding protein n=1 Tax=Aegilops tauschii subsp. strangulata TaxID=200361 RepID=A0A453JZC1_AEGTS